MHSQRLTAIIAVVYPHLSPCEDLGFKRLNDKQKVYIDLQSGIGIASRVQNVQTSRENAL